MNPNIVNLSLDLQIAEDGDDQPPPADFERWVSLAIGRHMKEAELTIRLVNEAEITELNHTYRNNNKATNVLSFPADLPEHIDIPLLGDMIICPSVVKREATEQHKALSSHWAHMVIHGTLHLLGYDHINEREAEEMENLEIQLLAGLGIDNPYIQATVNL